MITVKLQMLFFLLFPTLSFSQQYFVDETSTRIPQREDSAKEVGLGDIDSDGSMDVIVVCIPGTSYITYLLRNDGIGFFPEDSIRVLFNVSYNLTSVSLGDVERDGDYDLFFTDYYDQERLLINDGEGNYTDESESRLPLNPGGHPSSKDGALIDVDDDFDLDISFVNFSLNYNRLWLNRGNGYFKIASEQFPSGTENSNALAWGDVDGDFDLDCVIANNTGYPNRLMINDGTGWFTDETDERMPIDLSQSNGVSLVDIDSDRDLDIVITNGWFPSYEKIFINDGTGYYIDESAMRIPQVNSTASGSIAYGDIDNDGDQDLLISNFSTSGVDNQLYVNNGYGYYTDETEQRFPQEEEETRFIVLGDIDNDGDLDCFIANVGGSFDGEQNRLLINISTPDSFPPIIARTLIHSDTSDTTGPYIIASTVWDNISISIGEFNVKLHYRTNESAYEVVLMYDCGGYIYRYGIPGVSLGTRISYYIEAVDRNGNVTLDPPTAPDSVFSFMVTGTGIEEDTLDLEVPKAFALLQNYPNPFNPSTVIRYGIPEGKDSNVSLMIYNLHGKLVRKLVDEVKSSGTHSVNWDGRDGRGIEVASGVYFYRLQASDFTSTRKMMLLR